MTQFCAGFTISEASTCLSDAGGVEVNVLRITYAFCRFVRVGRRSPGFGISVGVLTVMREVGNH